MRRRFFTRCARGLVALLSGKLPSALALALALAFAGGSFQAVVAGSFNAANFARAMSNLDEAEAPLGTAGLLVRAIETGLASAMDALPSAGVSVLLEAGIAGSVAVSALVSALAGSAGTSAGAATTCG